MTTTPQTRISVPASAPRGSIVPIKALVSHVMETGDRRDAAGTPLPRNIVNSFACTFNDRPVFACTLGTGISTNPFFEFDLRLKESGRLAFTWIDDKGVVYENAAEIEAN
jgi:sulfur-oxidizing protein SoxZ